MFCSNCGEKNEEGAQFCSKCGAELSTKQNNSTNTTNNQKVDNTQNFNQKRSNKSNTGVILGVCGFFTCGICSIIGLIFSIQGLSESKKMGKKDSTAIVGIVISSIPLMLILLGILAVLANSKEIEVIDFSNKTMEEAKIWCEKEKANCTFKEEYSDTVPTQGFIEQSEEAGTKVNTYHTIYIKYSKGPKNDNENTNEESNDIGAEATIQETPEEYKATCQIYDYKEIARQPDNYKNTRAYFRAKVLQVTEHTFDSNKIDLRVDVTEGEYGLWNDAIYVTYKYKDGENRILEDDIINMYGTLEGTKSYTSVLGSKITIPMFKAKYIDLEQ